MRVVATAGHVDHGKSTLVRALTGMEPDRWAEERRRGMTIDLGFAWTDAGGEAVAFVDVPGHERFVTTMLAGVGPVPAVLLVVAADEGWMPQSAEHIDALVALGVRHGLLVITRSDLMDPELAREEALAHLAGTPLAGLPSVAVSAVTGAGMDALREAIAALVAGLPTPDPAADVRLWVDRSFTITGAGTVVTGTLPAGTVSVGDELAAGSRSYRVRGVQSLGRPATTVPGVARVALNLAGEDRSDLDRQSVLVTPGAWWHTAVVDVRLHAAGDRGTATEPPRRPLLHIGAAAVPAYLRPLGDDTARLTLDRVLPLRVGDRALLRDPGSRRLWGLTVLDPAPPGLTRRGAARRRADALSTVTGEPDGASELERRGIARLDFLRQIGVPAPDGSASTATPDGWLVGAGEADRLRQAMVELVTEHDRTSGADAGVPLATLAERLHVPSATVVRQLVGPPLRLVQGRVTGRQPQTPELAPHLERGVTMVEKDLVETPFQAPTADRLREVGLDARGVTAAARAGRLLHLGDGIVLLPGSDDEAARVLEGLPQPFTTSEARAALGTTRRVVLPLLQHLDKRGRTRRHPDDRRSLVERS